MSQLRDRARLLDERDDIVGAAAAYEELLSSGEAGVDDLIAMALGGGLGSLMDALGISGAAFTLGNVVLTREKSVDKLAHGELDHEIRHADQWAWSGLTTPTDPLAGQFGMFLWYLGFSAISQGTGHSQCWNPYEMWAGPNAGQYRC